MTEAEKIILGAVVAIGVWIIKSIVSFILVRGRISGGLIEEIHSNLNQVKEAKKYLDKLKSLIQVGQPLPYIDKFNKTNNSFYSTQIDNLPTHYGMKTIKKVNKFFYSFWELQVAIEGLINHLQQIKNEKRSVQKEDYERLKKKFERIDKLSDVLTSKKIENLSNLPENYEGRLGSDSII
jgi:hypothetical protein